MIDHPQVITIFMGAINHVTIPIFGRFFFGLPWLALNARKEARFATEQLGDTDKYVPRAAKITHVAEMWVMISWDKNGIRYLNGRIMGW